MRSVTSITDAPFNALAGAPDHTLLREPPAPARRNRTEPDHDPAQQDDGVAAGAMTAPLTFLIRHVTRGQTR